MKSIYDNDMLKTMYDAAISKYEGEVKGWQIMIRREQLSTHSEVAKQDNIDMLKRELRKLKWNLTRVKNLRKELDT
jgi:hypothetical protein